MDLLENNHKDPISDINAKWVHKENKFFSKCPNLLMDSEWKNISVKNKRFELTNYVIEDLKWLLELENDKFWSFMIYSKEAHELIFSALIECLPCYVRHSSLLSKEVVQVSQKIEKLIFLVFIRLSTANDSENHNLDNVGEILYNNYLFTVPAILDICLIYGTSNPELVIKIIHKVVTLSPNFLIDFKEMVPHFFKGLHLAKDIILKTNSSMCEKSKDLHYSKLQSLLFFLHDSVATIEIFLNLYPKACCIFFSSESLQEIISFYSNVLPEIQIIYIKNKELSAFLEFKDLFEKIRLDILKTVKALLDFKLQECKSINNNKEEALDEYLNLVQELLSEPNFVSDYNTLYSLAAEVEKITKIHNNIDFIKVNHILQSISLSKNHNGSNTDGSVQNLKSELEYSQDVEIIKFNSLVSEIKDIFPYLEETFIEKLLKCNNCSAEKVISIILDSSSTNKKFNLKSPSLMNQSNARYFKPTILNKSLETYYVHHEDCEFKDNNEQVKHTVNRVGITFPYMDSLNENYEDEYDDSYDDNQDLTIKEVNVLDPEIRPFVIPRVLRKAGERQNRSEENEEITFNTEEENEENKGNVLEFLKNPEEVREINKRKHEKQTNFKRERYEGPKKNVQKARNFKETHKSFIGNHNRKNQASAKRNF